MFISEVSKNTGLTKKAIEYDTLKGLVSPSVLQNGYKDYSEADVEQLHKIAVLRKLGIGTEQIRQVLADPSTGALHSLAVQQELNLQRQQAKKAVLGKLAGGCSYAEVQPELQAIENSKTITEKLLEAFPGYYGRFICLHFARFLNEPIETDDQQSAYGTILSFLDSTPVLAFPEELQEYVAEATKTIGTEQISKILDSVKETMEHPDKFLDDSKEQLEAYLEYKQSEEYKNSPACKLMELMKEFNSTSGYYDVFLPALRQLSSSYATYVAQMEVANEKLLERYPQVKEWAAQQDK